MRARFALASAAAAIAVFVAMLFCLRLGREIGLMHTAPTGSQSPAGLGVVEGVVSAILALMLGFVFSGATARFDQRRQSVVQQVNAIRTAWQRVDSVPLEKQPDIRNEIRRFVDGLVASYEKPGETGERPVLARVGDEIWSRSAAACLIPEGERARMLLLPALNDMFAAVERERLAHRIHPPAVIYVMLVLASLISALLAGYTMANDARDNWLLHAIIAAIVSLVLYVILQIEYPRLGLVRMDAVDRALVELRVTMG